MLIKFNYWSKYTAPEILIGNQGNHSSISKDLKSRSVASLLKDKNVNNTNISDYNCGVCFKCVTEQPKTPTYDHVSCVNNVTVDHVSCVNNVTVDHVSCVNNVTVDHVSCVNNVTVDHVSCVNNVTVDHVSCVNNVTVDHVSCVNNVTVDHVSCVNNVTVDQFNSQQFSWHCPLC